MLHREVRISSDPIGPIHWMDAILDQPSSGAFYAGLSGWSPFFIDVGTNFDEHLASREKAKRLLNE